MMRYKKSVKVMIIFAVVAAIALVVIGFLAQSEPQLAQTHTGCYYYKVEDLPNVFEDYLGYTPKMLLDRKKSVVTLYLREGYELKVPVGLYARDPEGNELWGFEVPPDKLDCFKDWYFLSYPCFSQELEREAWSYGLDGIYCNLEDLETIYTFLGWTSEKLEVYPDGSASFSDSDIRYYPKYLISENGEFYLEGRALSQMLYEHEMSVHPQETISLDIFFLEGRDR